MRSAERALWLAMAGYTLLLGFVTVRLHQALETGLFDLGIHTQALWLLGNGLPDVLTTRGLTLMSDHFTPIVNVLAPLYAHGGSPEALLLFQTAMLASGAWPLFRLCGGERTGLVFALLYLCHPALTAANLFDFHTSTLVAPLLLWALWALHGRHWSLYWISLLLVALCGEAMAITIAAMAWEAWRSGNRRAAVATFLLGCLCAGVAMKCMALANAGRPSQYRSLYAGPWLPRLFSLESLGYAALLFLPLGALPLMGWERLVPAVPVILGNLLTWRNSQRGMEYHYDAAILPFLLWAAELGWQRTRRRFPLMLALPVLLVLALVLKFSRWRIAFTEGSDPMTRAALRGVSASSSVSADNYVGAHLTHRRTLFLFPNPFQLFVWGNRTGALSEGQYITGHPPLPGEFRRAVQTSGVQQIVLDLQPGDIWPLHEEDRAYLLRELQRLPYYAVSQEGGHLRVLTWQGAGKSAMPWIEAHPSLSADGTRLAWESCDPRGTMVRRSQAGPFEWTQIFVLDVRTGGLQRLGGNGACGWPRWDSEGQRLTFVSEATDLVAGDEDAATDVFLCNADGSGLRRLEAPGRIGRSGCYHPAFGPKGGVIYLADGRPGVSRREFVGVEADTERSAFGPVCSARTTGWFGSVLDKEGRAWLVPGTAVPGCSPRMGRDVLVFQDLVEARWQLFRSSPEHPETRQPLLPEADDDCFEPALSADGRWLAFSSYASNLVAGDREDTCDVFLLDLQDKSLRCLSAGGDDNSFHPTISADGSTVAFATVAHNLLPDQDSRGDVLIWQQGHLRRAIP